MGGGMSRKEFLAEYKKAQEDKERNAAQRERRQKELVQQAIATLSNNQLQAEMNNLREELRQAELRASLQQQQTNMNMMRGLYMMSMLMTGQMTDGSGGLPALTLPQFPSPMMGAMAPPPYAPDDEDEEKNSDTDQAKVLRNLMNQASRNK